MRHRFNAQYRVDERTFMTMNFVEYLDLKTGEQAGDGTGSRTLDGIDRQPGGNP